MEKRVIKNLIAEKQEEILATSFIERPLTLEESGNYVFVGLRRAGKSYMLIQYIHQQIASGKMTQEDILYINFEDERVASINAEELNIFIECYNEMYNRKPVIFLDEIQIIQGWEKFVRRLADSKYRVFVTGSNAQMLSREIYTTLGGRFIIKEIYPFAFQEYLSYHHTHLDKNWEYNSTRFEVIRLFTDYFLYGGFSENFPIKDKRSWLNSLYQKILLGDIITRNDIRNENAIRVLIKKLAESVMQPSSLARLRNVVISTGASISHNTLTDYLRLIEDAYLIFGISNYSDKLTDKETLKKRYFFDNGLLNTFIFEPEAKLLENQVAICLKKKYASELYFYNKNIEVDFFLPQVQRAIQVSYSIMDDTTRQREVRALLKVAEIYDIKQLEIVTRDEERTISDNGREIEVIPIWKWLLKE